MSIGHRDWDSAAGAVGADMVSNVFFLSITGSTSLSSVFTLADAANRWLFYSLYYSITFSVEGHATLIAQRNIVVKLLDDPELIADAWRVELALAAPATEVRNASMSGTGFVVPGGLAFPVGVNAKVLTEVTVDGTEWGVNAFARFSARVSVTALAQEVAP